MIVPYSEFLNRPYITRIKARNLESAPVDIVKKTIDFINYIKDVRDKNEEFEKKGHHADKFGENMKDLLIKMHFDRVVALYFYHLGMLRVNPVSSNISAKDFDLPNPYIFHKGYSLSQGFVIRSETSKNLKDNMNFK